MGGIYVECDDFYGEDKSCSALKGVVEALRARSDLGAEARKAIERLATHINQPIGEFSITSTDVSVLLPHFRAYFDELRTKLNGPPPEEAPDYDFKAGLDLTEAKWGAGDGWRYLCLYDVCRAAEVSLRTRKPIQFTRD